MSQSRLLRIALVFKTRLEENIAILNSISTYNRFHEKWSAFLDDQALAQKDPEWLLSRGNWDGILCRHSSPVLFERCVALKIPVVDLSDDPHRIPGVPKIRPDNPAIGHSGAEHFLERGFRNFAFCGFENEAWSTDRCNGFREAIELVGQSCSVFESPYPKISTPAWEEAEEANISAWIETLPKPLAIMACNDLRALQVINACRTLDVDVPSDVAVLGSNNETLRCELSLPQLSSVPLNTALYGQLAAQTITALMHHQPATFEEQFIEPAEVVTRRSTDFLSVEDPHVRAALQVIREQATKGITVDDVTRSIHVSRSLLERRFRKFLGHSPQAEIRNLQIRRIKELLRETDYTLAHIAELVGFEHPEYMCVVFKKATQLTPNRYRQRVLGKTDDLPHSIGKNLT
jgi:LacI family transcriptional regulator